MDLLQVKRGGIVKCARISKLSGTGECPITLLFELKASTHLIQQHLSWLVFSPSASSVVVVISQGFQEC